MRTVFAGLCALAMAMTVACGDQPRGMPDARSVSTRGGAADVPLVTITETDKLPGCGLEITVATNVNDALADCTLELAWWVDGVLAGTQCSSEPFVVELGTYQAVALMVGLVDPSGPGIEAPIATAELTVKCVELCSSLSDCSLADPCAPTYCIPLGGGSPVCVQASAIPPGCCSSKTACVTGICDLGTNACVECAADGDCDDANACTTDACLLQKCVHEQPDPMCCDCEGAPPAAGLCHDGKVCTVDTCNCDTSTCGFSLVVPAEGFCCEGPGDGACDDGNPYTVDACVANLCVHVPGLGCGCASDADCDDGDVCTTDSCESCMCVAKPVSDPNCCKSDDDCDDGSPSTQDECVGFQCVHLPIGVLHGQHRGDRL